MSEITQVKLICLNENFSQLLCIQGINHRWNTFIGLILPGETPDQAITRSTMDQVGIDFLHNKKFSLYQTHASQGVLTYVVVTPHKRFFHVLGPQVHGLDWKPFNRGYSIESSFLRKSSVKTLPL